jgi:hypothetical protein
MAFSPIPTQAGKLCYHLTEETLKNQGQPGFCGLAESFFFKAVS